VTNEPLQQALSTHQQGDLVNAIAQYTQLLQSEPDNPEYHHLLGIALAQQGNYDASLTHLETATALVPNAANYHNSHGNTLKYLGRFEAAIKAYEQSIALKPRYASAHSNLANIYLTQGKDALALKHYQLAVHNSPNNPHHLYNLATYYANLSRYDDAMPLLQQTLSLDPNHVESHIQIAQIYQHQHQPQQAQQHFLSALEHDPNNATLHHGLATCYLEQDDTEQAKHHLKQTLQQHPKHKEALHNLGAIYLHEHQLGKALQCYMRIIEQGPNLDGLYNVGVIHMYQEHHQTAISYFLAALKLNDKHVASHINLANTYLKQSHYDEATQHYHIAQQLDPDNQSVAYMLSALTQEHIPAQAPLAHIEQLFDQYAPYFEKHLAQHLDYRVPQALYDLVIEILNTSKTDFHIIDIGCGTGLAGEKFAPITSSLIGIDASDNMCQQAEKKHIYTELKHGEATEQLTHYSDIDIIIAADVFGYIGDLSAIFDAVQKALKPNGLFAFSIETTNQQQYELQRNTRYAHSKHYIEALALQFHFEITACRNQILRKQQKHPVEGYIYVLSSKTVNN